MVVVVVEPWHFLGLVGGVSLAFAAVVVVVVVACCARDASARFFLGLGGVSFPLAVASAKDESASFFLGDDGGVLLFFLEAGGVS